MRFLSLGCKIDPKEYDLKNQRVKPKSIHAPKINAIIAKYRLEVETIAFDLTLAGKDPDFDAVTQVLFKKANEKPENRIKLEVMLQVADELEQSGTYTYATAKSYRAAFKYFAKNVEIKYLDEVTRRRIEEFKGVLLATRGQNLSIQYTTMFLALFRATVRHLDADIKVPLIKQPRPERMTEKKLITTEEFEALQNAYRAGQLDPVEHEVLRKFLVLCKGLRHSDACRIAISKIQTFLTKNGQAIRYFSLPAKKTKVAGIIFFKSEESDLIESRNGFLFARESVSFYNTKLKKLTKRLLGKEVTSHYGRHFAGQAIITAHGYDEVKTVLGIRSQSAAEVYAQRNVEATIERLLEKEHEKDR